MDTEEHPLTGGNATPAVVRIGATVRKPWTASTPAVQAFLDAVRSAGVDVPQHFGRDESGRQVIEFIPGTPALELPPLTPEDLARVGRMVRRIHDASKDFDSSRAGGWEVLIPPAAADLVFHNDLAPWNLIIGERWVFIDWDGAGPSTRLWDLAYAAQAFTLSDYHREPVRAAARLRAFIDGYGAGEELRGELPHAMGERAAAMHALLRRSHLTGREPWGSMYSAGHGDHWRRAAAYAVENRDVWLRGLLGP
ncbi:phosphotransferase [Arthrobacter zhaoguopingii]|uniref:phosphotransferase n=1 Tax=Arthrobacter zhaoguopingii TaxID=2681491 RepID=UPI001356842F|nr:phosphotransferase [Arthrobacter zhaoguopingii]